MRRQPRLSRRALASLRSAVSKPSVNQRVDRGEQGGRLLRPALLAAQAGEAHGAAQFPGLRVLPARDVDALLDGRLGLAHRPGAGEQGLALEPIELRFKRRSPHLFDRLQPGGDRRKRSLRACRSPIAHRPATPAAYVGSPQDRNCPALVPIWASPFSLSPEAPSAHPFAQRASAWNCAMRCSSQIRKARPA